MAWARLDDQFWRDPDRWEVGLDGVAIFVLGLSYAADNLTDGFLPVAWVRSELGRKTSGVMARLERVGWVEGCEGGWGIVNYLRFNRSREQVLAERSALSEKRSAAGRKGAAARWQPNGNGHDKPAGKGAGK